MGKLAKISYPNISFLDSGRRTKTVINASKERVSLHTGVTSRGVRWYQVKHRRTKDEGGNLNRFMGKEDYDYLKKYIRTASGSAKKSKRSKPSKPSKCSRTKSGKARLKRQCKTPCKWVKSKSKTKSGSRKKSYCRK